MDIKVLITFIASSVDDFEIRIAVNNFLEHGYRIEPYNMSEQPVFIHELPNVIRKIQEMYDSTDTIRFVLLSDLPHILFSWFRCYNHLVSNFVYIIPRRPIQNQPIVESSSIILNLSNFINIDEETIQGKIYTNLHPGNSLGLTGFLLSNQNFKHFEHINKFPYTFMKKKQSITKTYKINDTLFSFRNTPGTTSEIIDVTDTNNKPPCSTIDILNDMQNHIYFAAYLLFGLYNELTNISEENLIQMLYMFMLQYRNYPLRDQKDIYLNSIQLLSFYKLPFKHKIYFVSSLTILSFRDEQLLNIIMNELLRDTQFISCHHTLLIQTLFFISSYNVSAYENYAVDKRTVFKKLCQAYASIKELCPSTETQIRNKCIVFITGSLLSTLHSPSLGTLQFAGYLSNLYPDHRIVIISEDTFCEPDTVAKPPWFFLTDWSLNSTNEHNDYLRNTQNIEIIYMNPTGTKTERISKTISCVLRENPKIIYSNAELSIAVELLYPCFPVAYLSYGTVIPAGSADIYLFKDKDEAVRENKRLETIPENRISQYTNPMILPSPQRRISRNEYGFDEEDFVLITVGNRLNAELSREFIDTVLSFLSSHANVKWLIAGIDGHPYINSIYRHLADNQIVFVRYEPDLPALYKICDVFVNPVRHGGGASIVMAMDASLPIVILSAPSDGLVFVGSENSVEGSVRNFEYELNHLYCDINYRIAKGKLMKERLLDFSVEKFMTELSQYFLYAEESFKKRNPH